MSKIPCRLWAAVAAALLFVSCNPETPRFAFKHSERRGRLNNNGLRFVVMPDPSTQLIEVDVRYEVGSKEDPPGKAGLAHLVEHMMFQQKPDGPTTKPLMHFISQMTLAMNAYTSSDQTHYMLNGRTEQLDAFIKVEAMRMHYGCQTISEEEFEREREVVRNEIRGSFRNPAGQIRPLTLASVYPEGHPYRNTTGGDDQQLSNITLQDACDFMHKYYTPERATVIVAGGVSVEDTVASLERWFGKLEKRTSAPRSTIEPIHITKGKETRELDVERPYVTVAWALPPANSPEGEAANFGIWGAFFDAANKVSEYECATDVQPVMDGGKEAPVFFIALELKNMDKVDECLDLVWKAARGAYRGYDEGTYEQLKELKDRRKAQLIASLEPLFGIGARTDQVGDMVQFNKEFDWDSQDSLVIDELNKIEKFDMAKVGRVLKKVLDPDKAKVVVFKPSKQGIKGDTRSKLVFKSKSHDQIEQPEVDPSEAKRPMKVATELKGLSNASRFQLGNGMNVVLLPIDGIMPLAAVQLIFNVGDSSRPDNPALASAAADFLSQPLDAEASRRTGIGFNCGSTPDHTICSTRGVNIYLDVMIKGLERFIRAGEYRQEQVEEWQKQVKTAYKLRRPQQELEFERQQLIAVFGPDHPYTRTGVLVPTAVGKIGRDALTSFRDTHYSAANATLIVAGTFDPKRAESLIRGSFGEWSSGHKDAPVTTDPFKRSGPSYIGVVSDEDPQMNVRIIYPAPAGIDGQEAGREVLTEMLNGRMWDIRAKLGSTYGAYASRDIRRGPSRYQMGGAIDTPRTGEAIKAMRDSLDALRRGENFEVDFVRARRKLVQRLLGESTMSMSLAARLGTISRYGLSTDYYNKLLQQLAAVSPAQVKALLKKELDPNYEIIVTMGDRPSVTKAFSDAGISDIKVVEPEYK
ncbi:MAG: M16 family metallopeptidase [Kofleriaceae bacterium]